MKRFFVTSLVLLLVACATGTPFKWDQARKVREGMTKDEVVQIMGKPHTVKSEDGVLRYVWVEVNAITFATKTFSLDFIEGKAQQVPEIPSEFN